MGWSYGEGSNGTYGSYDYGYSGTGDTGSISLMGDSGNGIEQVTVTATSYDGDTFNPEAVYVYGDSTIIAAYNGPMRTDSIWGVLGDLEQYFLDINSMPSLGNQTSVTSDFNNTLGAKTIVPAWNGPDTHGNTWQDINGDLWTDRNGDGLPDQHIKMINGNAYVDYGDWQGMHPYGTGTVPPPPPAPFSGPL